jgi:hypothetical protein
MKILYNISFLNRDGLRTLFGSAQGRHMHATRRSAEQLLRDTFKNSGEDRLVEIFGVQARGTFRVDSFQCHDSGDPIGIYVDAPERSVTLAAHRRRALQAVADGNPWEVASGDPYSIRTRALGWCAKMGFTAWNEALSRAELTDTGRAVLAASRKGAP